MQRRQFTSGALSLVLLSSLGLELELAHAAGLTEGEAAKGIRAALERGAIAAVDLLGKPDGFLGNPQVRIPLPPVLEQAAKLLKATGQQAKVEELETAMNRGAEAAVPKARDLLVNTARKVTVDDALKIVRGGDTAVTDYFAGKTRQPLAQQFLPIVTQATEKVSLAQKFNAVAGQAGKLGLLKGDDANVQRYVTGKTLDGLFAMIAEEERKLRQDPVGSGSKLLRKVFGG